MTDVGREYLNASFPAVPATVGRVRRTLAALATRAGATPDRVDAVRLAASEALTNVVVHAYRGDAGLIHVSAVAASNELWIVIGDDGYGLQAGSTSDGLGMGLTLIADASDGFVIVNRPSGGIELRMRFTLGARPRRRYPLPSRNADSSGGMGTYGSCSTAGPVVWSRRRGESLARSSRRLLWPRTRRRRPAGAVMSA